MVTTKPKQSAKYEYLVLAFHIDDSEVELWEALSERHKADLSREFYGLVALEMDGLQESAALRLPKIKHKNHARRLFLLPLPEHDSEIRFIKANIRRPAFMDHLKKLILHIGKGQVLPAPNASVSQEFQAAKPPETPVGQERGLRSPRELFHDPNMLIQTMLGELMKPGTERRFDWDRIQPASYPEAVRASMLFSKLEDYWSRKNKKS